jgi:trimeric autotransporter adhesin
MTKARILANLISDNAELADGQISVAEVVGAAPLASPTFTGTATGTFSGPLTGDVVGNLTGDVTGALTGDVTAPDIDLTAISSTIADTAVDIFVYDTSKDSDGGAWRKRTQHTSWYNETLNTATRGSRKEFPAVAVIVAEATQVTIYDGDDPDMPMWMVFNSVSAPPKNMINTNPSNGNLTSISAINGVISVGGGGGNVVGVSVVNFISDSGVLYWVGQIYTYGSSSPISQRNGGSDFINPTSVGLVNALVNDVAMTVLPNAPIDAATGLPVPTIAVATDGGVSVIKDDGTVVDLTGGIINHLVFYDNNKRLLIRENGNACSYGTIPTADAAWNSWREGFFNETTSFPSTLDQTNTGLYSNGDYDLGVPSGSGLSLIRVNPSDQATSTGAYITSSYNTGWMNGDIKLATLSDTDDTDVTGSELVTNGTFDSDISGWTAVNGSIAHDTGGDGGRLKLTTTSTFGYAYQAITLEAGKTYTATVDIDLNTTNQAFLMIGTSAGNNDIAGPYVVSDGTLSATFTATQTSNYITLKQNSVGIAFYDNISVRLAEEDRSVNGNGLQVFGTVTKNPVNTGADLVAYSGFSTTRRLEQPYNSDLDFGNTMSFMLWMKDTDSGMQIFERGTRGNDNSFGFYIDGAYDLRFYASSDGTTDQQFEIPLAANLVGWNLVCFTMESGTVKGYLNGDLKYTGAFTGSLHVGSRELVIGVGSVSSTAWPSGTALSLLRISATAPSPEQIAKIYEDEKVLFQENAQATLYGSSDAVTALAYDDSTELLHVGTSAGRSVFQGLRRVDNTTDAVGAAISASNGLVAED